MRRFLIILSLMFVFTLMANAADILLWHFDPGNYDTTDDPEAGEFIDCAYWIEKSLDAGAYDYDYHNDTLLPSDISSYDIIFGTLGFVDC